MKVSELLQIRREQWKELEGLCDIMETRRRSQIDAGMVSRFSSLYRAACADLALADENRLPQNTTNYLHQLVGRAHNQLYRSRRFDLQSWKDTMFIDVPQRIFNNRCVQLAFLIFWGAFLLSAALAAASVSTSTTGVRPAATTQREKRAKSSTGTFSARMGKLSNSAGRMIFSIFLKY